MKRFIFFVMVASSSSVLFAERIDIELDKPFRLNPILGVNGDENEASSKFVQRLIFSPLVFPIEDPYLQDTYRIAVDLSIIDGLEMGIVTGTGTQWSRYNMKGDSGSSVSSTLFRVHIRPNLYFWYFDSKKNAVTTDPFLTLTMEDVVYSYRLARITADRAYYNYVNVKTRGELGLNTLLYSKLRSFIDIYCDPTTAEYVYFEMESNYTCRQFLNALVYVPILSSKQIQSEDMKSSRQSDDYKAIHSRLHLRELLRDDKFNNREYDFYDFSKIEQTSIGDRFFAQPMGYGQYVVKSRPISLGGRDPRLYHSCFFQKNTEWCNFPGETSKRVGNVTFNHNEYRVADDEIQVDAGHDFDVQSFINDSNENKILYNIPLSASMFEGDPVSIRKRKMQISHNLYGIYFGPDIQNQRDAGALPYDARVFFAAFADRVRVENLNKYITRDADFTTFDSRIKSGDGGFLSDLQIQRLYYPFFMGGSNDPNRDGTDIGRYYRGLTEKDVFYQQYNYETGGDDIARYYNSLNSLGQRMNFFENYVGGAGYPSVIMSDITSRYHAVKDKIVFNDSITIDIFYKKSDFIGQTIAMHFRDCLQTFFNSKGIDITNNINEKELVNYGEWRQRAVSNARSRTLSFLVKGWNYKFDLLNELSDQFIDPQSLSFIEGQYRQLVSGSSKLGSETIVQRIAEQFVTSTVMAPLIGVQNYAVYNTSADTSVAGAFNSNPDIEILLLPFYWRKK
ncbi:MAG: hypothetical protein LBL45_12195 [Treponema sp.]|jgi:hypothetical protein|nr:hypothetical protein [Treponema sp.]